jgi:hypothetical protein
VANSHIPAYPVSAPLKEVYIMKRIIQQYTPNMAMVLPEYRWPKCDFCGLCHPAGPDNCPRIKSFDRIFKGKKD